jgi:glucose/arabinose dehydrogenase
MHLRSLAVLVAVLGCGGNDNHSTDGGGSGSGSANVDAGVTPADADPSCATPGQLPAMKAQLVAQGLSQSVYVAQPTGSTDLFVVEKQGKIKIVRNGSVLATPFLTISDLQIPSPSAEGGLLSVAFHPSYAMNGRFFVFATVTGDRAVVREYARSANPAVATATPVQEIIGWSENGYNNVGGTVVFGADGYLYVSAGDGAFAPDAMDLTSRRGKILRVDVNAPATAPPGNITTAGADPFIWDYGLRNPYRMAFDRQTHELYIGDAGDALQEEVDIEPSAMGKHNYGWPIVEGNVCHDGTTTCDKSGTTSPQYTRPHQATYSVLIGGSLYRGSALPCLRGTYIFAIFGSESHVLSWMWTGSAIVAEHDLTATFNVDPDVVSINEDATGELYLVTFGGNVYKIVPA